MIYIYFFPVKVSMDTFHRDQANQVFKSVSFKIIIIMHSENQL